MDDLVRWLGKQLDIDAAQARETADEYGAVWTANDAMGSVSSDIGADVVDDPNTPRAFIAAHDPARVLREIDAKRRLLAIHRPYVPEPDQACLGCAGGIMFTSCPVVRLLALPYADRPGYREEWRP